MEKISSKLIISLILTLFLGTNSLMAQTGSAAQEAVNLMCQAYDAMAAQVKAATTMEEIENLNFDQTIASVVDNADISGNDDLNTYKLTSSDKNALKRSFGGFVDAMCLKLADLSDGAVSYDMMQQGMAPMVEQHSGAVNRATSFIEYTELLDKVFN